MHSEYRPPLYIKTLSWAEDKDLLIKKLHRLCCKICIQIYLFKICSSFSHICCSEEKKETNLIPTQEIFIDHAHNMFSRPSLVNGFTVDSAGMITAVSRVSFVIKLCPVWMWGRYQCYTHKLSKSEQDTLFITEILSSYLHNTNCQEQYLRLASDIHIISHFKMRGIKGCSRLYSCFRWNQEPAQYFCWHHSRISEKSTVLFCEL